MIQSEELIAPYGINCGLCKYYLAKVKGLYKSKRSGCIGCIPRNKGCTYQGGCEQLRKGTVRFCFECTNFPCTQLEKLNKRYSTKYHTNLIENLLNIKKNGTYKWLKGEEQGSVTTVEEPYPFMTLLATTVATKESADRMLPLHSTKSGVVIL